MPTSSFRQRIAGSTFFRLSMGSPMPINTTFDTLRPMRSSTVNTWSTISYVCRLRAKPPLPVAQNVQRSGQPTCELTHAVSRWRSDLSAGMATVSTSRLSASRSRYFCVPSLASTDVCTGCLPTRSPASPSCSRSALEKVVTPSSSLMRAEPYMAACSCLPRKAGKSGSTADSAADTSVWLRPKLTAAEPTTEPAAAVNPRESTKVPLSRKAFPKSAPKKRPKREQHPRGADLRTLPPPTPSPTTSMRTRARARLRQGALGRRRGHGGRAAEVLTRHSGA
mmetsp:Transcript_2866/g.8711  ORF Transcript_2866/g.8711 Transcript_2866/m.8711 type:complete len:280 (-) Transcript_2866:247-1086(-)